MKLLVASVLLVFLICPKEIISVPVLVVQVAPDAGHVHVDVSHPEVPHDMKNPVDTLFKDIKELVNEVEKVVPEQAKGLLEKIVLDLNKDKEEVCSTVANLKEQLKTFANNLEEALKKTALEDIQADERLLIQQVIGLLEQLKSAVASGAELPLKDISKMLQEILLNFEELKKIASTDVAMDVSKFEPIVVQISNELTDTINWLQGSMKEKIQQNIDKLKSVVNEIKGKVSEDAHELLHKLESGVDKLDGLFKHAMHALKKRSPVAEPLLAPVNDLLGSLLGGMGRKKRSPEPEPVLSGVVGLPVHLLSLTSGLLRKKRSPEPEPLVPSLLNAVPLNSVLSVVPVAGVLRKKRSPEPEPVLDSLLGGGGLGSVLSVPLDIVSGVTSTATDMLTGLTGGLLGGGLLGGSGGGVGASVAVPGVSDVLNLAGGLTSSVSAVPDMVGGLTSSVSVVPGMVNMVASDPLSLVSGVTGNLPGVSTVMRMPDVSSTNVMVSGPPVSTETRWVAGAPVSTETRWVSSGPTSTETRWVSQSVPAGPEMTWMTSGGPPNGGVMMSGSLPNMVSVSA